MSKKLLVLALCMIFVFSFAACGNNKENSTTDGTESTVEKNTVDETTTEGTVTEENTTEETTVDEEKNVSETKNATLTVEQVEDIAGEYGTVFNASADEYAFYAVFRSDVRITDVKVLDLTFLDADENGNITFDREVLHTVEEIGPDFNLAVHLTADGSIPAFGISYVDTDGTEKAFSVNMSGEDGSLYLSAIN